MLTLKTLLFALALYISIPLHGGNEQVNSEMLKNQMFDIKEKVENISRECNDCKIKNGKITSKNNKEITLHLATDSNHSNQLLAFLITGSLTTATSLLLLSRDPFISVKTLLISSILFFSGLTLICSNNELLRKYKKK